MRTNEVDLQLADLISDDMHVAKLADASCDGVRNFILSDERVNHRAGAVNGLARVGIEQNGPPNVGVRYFAHGFEREIVSVDVQGLQGSSQFPVVICILRRETLSYTSRAERAASFLNWRLCAWSRLRPAVRQSPRFAVRRRNGSLSPGHVSNMCARRPRHHSVREPCSGSGRRLQR